ncbi:MAG: peptidoglycan recognition family protein [Bacillota bacterium]|nr:peptidoglycan recognition family protein [Bacillota bacterium]
MDAHPGPPLGGRGGQCRRAYHKSLGWRDVGYHYLIERDGRVVNGRPPTMRGAHCVAGNMNRKALGICLIGNMENHPPTPAQWESLVGLVRRLAAEHRVPVTNVLGHGEVPGAATACPGRHTDMAALRRELDGRQSSGVGRQASDDGGREEAGAERTAVVYRVQVGAYERPEAAAAVAAELESLGYEAWVRRD